MCKKKILIHINIFLGKAVTAISNAIRQSLKFTLVGNVRFIVAVFTAALMLLLTIACDRLPHSFGNEELNMKKLQLISMLIDGKTEPVPENILPINISFDRQLTPIYDEYGISCGKIDVTDRHKLLDFLKRIRNADYRAIAIDIFFDRNLPAEGDTALFKYINNMSRIFVPLHSDRTISPLISRALYANGDYSINLVSNNFTKYNYNGQDGNVSIASAVFNMYHNIKKHQQSLFDNSCMILPLPVSVATPYTEDCEKLWYNLGKDILDVYSDKELEKLVKDKIIIIGDYCISDMHDSYVGQISGPAVIINAINALEKGRNKLNLWSVVLTFIVYFLIAYFLIQNLTLWRLIGWTPQPIASFILNFVGLGTILFLLQLIQFLVFCEFHDTLLVTTFISLYSIICQKINEHYL